MDDSPCNYFTKLRKNNTDTSPMTQVGLGSIYSIYRELEPAMKRRQGMFVLHNLWYLLKIYTHLFVDIAYWMSLQVRPNEWKWSGMGKLILARSCCNLMCMQKWSFQKQLEVLYTFYFFNQWPFGMESGFLWSDV